MDENINQFDYIILNWGVVISGILCVLFQQMEREIKVLVDRVMVYIEKVVRQVQEERVDSVFILGFRFF